MSSDDFRKYAKIINEGLGYAVAEPQEESSVSYSSVKNTDKGQVKIEATAQDMPALEDILKLAGIEKDPEHHHVSDDEPKPVDDEPKDVCDCCGNVVDDEGNCGCGPECPHCGGKPKDDEDDSPNYSTDKKVILSYLKDKLQNQLY